MASDLKKLYEFIKVSDKFEEEGYKQIYFNNHVSLMIKKDNLEDHLEFLDRLYQELFYGKINIRNFYSHLITFIAEKKTKKEDLKKIIKKLHPIKVYQPIFGVNTKDKVHLKDCVIYNLQKNYKQLYDNANPEFKNFLEFNKHTNFIIEVTVNGYNSDAAIELANQKISRLINFFYFLNFGQINPKFINISTKEEVSSNDVFAYSSNGWAYNYGINTNTLLFDLDNLEKAVQHNKEGNRLLEIILNEKEEQEEFDNIIQSAINWFGESLSEKQLNVSLLKSVIALESIFYYQERLLSPSILYTICTSSALILGKNYDEKIEIETKLKNIYGIRSAISHAGNGVISIFQRDYVLKIIKRLIDTFLTPEYALCKNKEDLMKKVKEIRYNK
ncbi:hypothetical protein HMPREF1049_0148 [Fusobacterium necrophorum subsp. funduliforme ATCC 51357]|uniref:HEPN domain-containing protein n=1 Tax=Fusobacterium necrophorum TaxID=859 RepID=UPI00025E5C39|nr:HEPN domain-containing protein [Fusobacterium necrophorum]EIJ72008.1 hypothetical protein HMPREF1049_0148 [Fusobacterium necrophorum subsp. funduliforme ATCC 51357]KAB0553500.1 hypothetical protein F7P76_04065 [Fusobacterium necrophorum subsp. funduliforme]